MTSVGLEGPHFHISPPALDGALTPSSRAPRAVLAYDDHCGPCSSFKDAVKLLDARKRLSFVSLGEADSSGLLAGVPQSSRYSSFHLILPVPGAVWSGPGAILPLVRLISPLGQAAASAIEALPGGVTTVSFAYAALSRLHSSCSRVDPPPRGNSRK
jgi:predicted DCC family thiol-disulfide oxidoreductase YuxK